MKKFLKVFAFCLFVCGLLALMLCYIIIPNETKCAIDIVVEYLNKPLGLGIGCSLTIGGILLFLIRYTSFGHVALDKIKQKVEEDKSKAKDYYELAIKKQEETKALLDGFSYEIDVLVEKVAVVCETSPNAKVKALADDIRSTENKIKGEIINGLSQADSDLANYIKEKEKEHNLAQKYYELLEKVERLEKEYGEREETIDGSSKEE